MLFLLRRFRRGLLWWCSLNDDVVENRLDSQLIHLQDCVEYIFALQGLFLPLWVCILFSSYCRKELVVPL